MILKVLSKLINPLKLITWILKAAGEGGLGPQVKAAYWALVGKKSWIIALGAGIFALLTTLAQDPATCAVVHCDDFLQVLTRYWPEILAALGVAALDDAVRTEPPAK